jgi:hypothetical protein
MRTIRLPLIVATVALATLSGLAIVAPSVRAQPSEFPDVELFPAVELTPYQVLGAHPSTSGWVFQTPGGLRCMDSLIAELGLFCQGPIPGAPDGENAVGVSLAQPAELSRSDLGPDDRPYPVLPTGTKIAAGNGVVCAVLTDKSLACRATKPASWPADTPDPPDRHYGEHGFVLSPAGNRFF